MAEFDWKRLVAGIAPVLGTALGGPLIGAAVGQIGSVLLGNPSATEDQIAEAMRGGLSGEQIVALKEADIAFLTRMRELDIDVEKLNADTEKAYLQDVQDARARQVATKDPTPQVILAVLFVLWAGTFIAFYTLPLPADEFLRALIVRAYATIETGLTGAIAYFIGSSRGSKQSGDAVRKIAEKNS